MMQCRVPERLIKLFTMMADPDSSARDMDAKRLCAYLYVHSYLPCVRLVSTDIAVLAFFPPI